MTGRGTSTVDRKYRYDRTSLPRWLLAHVACYKLHVPFYVLAVVAWDVLSSAIPWATGRGFDAVLRDAPDVRGFGLVVLGLLAIVLVRGLFGAASTYLLDTVANGIERDMREELYLGLLGKSQAFFDRRRVGDLMAGATNDASQVNLMFQPGIEFLFISVFGTVVPLVFIGFIEPDLLLTPLLFVAAFVAAVRLHNRRLGPASDAMQERFGEMNAHLTETVSGIELVQSVGHTARTRRRFEASARAYRDAFVRQGHIRALYVPPLLLSLALVGALLHGLLLVTRGQLTVGDLVAYLGLVGVLIGPIEAFGAGLAMSRAGLSGARRILELLNDGPEPDQNPSGYNGELRGDIRFENVTFGYDASSVIENISFHAAPGETVAVIGAAGSGKSTLTKLLNRTYDPQSGRILLDGVDLQAWDLGALRAQISVIEQDVILFSRSIAENIAFGAGREVNREEVERAARGAHAHDFICRFEAGYDTTVGERGATLSGGQRQRIAIARALLADPHILVMDAATSAVDSATEEDIRKAIRRIAAGRTTFLITHRLSHIKHADKVLVLDRGKLMDQGRHDELMERCALYRRIFAAYV